MQFMITLTSHWFVHGLEGLFVQKSAFFLSQLNDPEVNKPLIWKTKLHSWRIFAHSIWSWTLLTRASGAILASPGPKLHSVKTCGDREVPCENSRHLGDRSRGEVYLLLQLMNEAEYLMKNYGDRGGCYPPFFVFTTKTTHPRPQVFSVNVP